jgi:hypothetical protein
MTRDHSRIEELMAADALGGLDEDDRAALASERAAHGDCEECANLEAGFDATAGRLAFALDPIPGDDDAADAILRRAGETGAHAAPRPVRRFRALIAAAVVILVAAVVVRDLTGTQPISVAFSGTVPAHLEMRFTPGDAGAKLRGSDFAALPSGRVYELWMIRDGTPLRATCFTPDAGQVQLALSHPVEASDVMAVTVESASCPSAPTTLPILTADLSKVS